MSKKPFVMGMDIGYSNLKLRFGYAGEDSEALIRPVGAAPEKYLPMQIAGGISSIDGGVFVTINDESWVAAVEPDQLQGWDRELHPDYPSSNQYYALFKAALTYSGVDVVDVLVTGLPVDQYKDKSKQDALVNKLTGVHQITNKKSVEVKRVIVVAQPSGAYMNLIHEKQSDEDLMDVIMDGRTIVIDSGFFSSDWVILEQGAIRYNSSGTSLKAMSRVLEETSQGIARDYGYLVPVEKIERAIRQNKSHVVVTGKKVALEEYFKAAAYKVSTEALIPLQTSMRDEDVYTDVLLLAGGGGSAYKKAAKNIFPDALVMSTSESALDNANGFYFTGINI